MSNATSGFPPDAFDADALKSGAILLHVFGVVYLDYALALLAYNFMVPTIFVIMEKVYKSFKTKNGLFVFKFNT